MSRIVELHDRAPLVIRKDQIQGDATYVCRCGLSNQWPMCDGTHKQTVQEPTDRVFLYTRANGQLQKKEVTAVKPGEADPRKGSNPTIPKPGTETEATKDDAGVEA